MKADDRAENALLRIRAADAGDDDFILALVPRFVDFELPGTRERDECAAGIYRDLEADLLGTRANSHLFIGEDEEGNRLGFLRLITETDFFSAQRNCHISDLAVAPGHDGRGLGSSLLQFAERWAVEHACERLTLAVFPGNNRARALYARHGFSTDLLRLGKLLK